MVNPPSFSLKSPPLVALEGVSRVYSKGRCSALCDLSLTIDNHEYLAIMGPSGSGKSTLLHLISGLDLPTSGRVLFEGREHLKPWEWALLRARRIGFVFQAFNLLPTLDAGQNIEVAMIGVTRRAGKRRQRAKELLSRVGLAGRLTHLPGELSGGEKQRLAIARSLANSPDLILADMMTLEGSHLTIAVGWTPGSYLWRTLRLVEGRMPSAGEEEVILLGQSVAEALHKKPGDFIRLRERDFRIIGLFRIGGVVGNNLAILPLPVLQAMMGRRDKVTLFHIRVDQSQEPGKMAAVRTRLQKAFPNLSFVETSQVADNDMIVKLFRAIAWSISLIAIVIALVVVLNTLLMAVIERTHEIGILSALGWPTRRIVGIIVLEGLLLAFLGGAAGLGIGVAGLTWLTGLPVLRGIIETEISGRLLLEILGSVVLLGGLGSLYPAWRAAHLNPVEALRNE